MTSNRVVGITVLPEYIQTEGVDGVLDSLARAGATAVSTSPYVMEPADEKTGSREPPGDSKKGIVRLLDRPLWGKREIYVRTEPSFIPDLSIYEGLRYQPPEPGPLTVAEGGIVADFIRAAKAKGLKVYFQVMSAIPPGYRVQFGGPEEDDIPRLPGGVLPSRRLDNNGSLASPHIVDYGRAMLRDLCRAYPDIDGFRMDWPEYPPYTPDGVFLDFGTHAKTAAELMGLDFARMDSDVGTLRSTLLGGLNDEMLEDGTALRQLAAKPGVSDWVQFKTMLAKELLVAYRAAIDTDKELIAMAFPPPWSTLSGLPYSKLDGVCSSVQTKLYTMHWPTILRFYGDAILDGNPGLSPEKLLRFMLHYLDIADDAGLANYEDYAYPEPEEAHPCGFEAQVRKIRQAQAEAGSVPVVAAAHSYGPLDDVRARLRAAWEGSTAGVWVNRYCYIADEKLDIIREETAQ
ncbi:MAG: hypothetical protein ISR44_05920 [Rhodospirillales bacterium]|nr:hypothetical protein [Rhodospirillales bacterium]